MENVRKTMDPRVMDIIISVAALVILLVLLITLPLFLNPGVAYLAGLIIFIVVMAGAGIVVNQRVK